MANDQHDKLPTPAELAKFDLWSVAAFAARCARRVQPLYHATWLEAGVGYGVSLEQAIRVAQNPVSARRAFAAVKAAAAAAKAAYAAAAPKAVREASADTVTYSPGNAAFAAAMAAQIVNDAVSATEFGHSARAAADAAVYTIRFADSGCQQLTRLSADDIVIIRDRPVDNSFARPGQVHFGPLWGGTACELPSGASITARDRPTFGRMLKHYSPQVTLEFAARCVQRVHYLADLDPTADTTGVVSCIWQIENTAWSVRPGGIDTGPEFRQPASPVGATPVSARRWETGYTVLQAAREAYQAAKAIETGPGWVDHTIQAMEEAHKAAELADVVVQEEEGTATKAHQNSFLAGMWDDLVYLESRSGIANPTKEYRPLWAFHETTDLPERITDLRLRYTPPPKPLILPRSPQVSEDEQRWIESYASQLVGSDDAVRAWFNLKSRDLGNKTPRQILDAGNLGLLEFHIQSALNGDFG